LKTCCYSHCNTHCNTHCDALQHTLQLELQAIEDTQNDDEFGDEADHDDEGEGCGRRQVNRDDSCSDYQDDHQAEHEDEEEESLEHHNDESVEHRHHEHHQHQHQQKDHGVTLATRRGVDRESKLGGNRESSSSSGVETASSMGEAEETEASAPSHTHTLSTSRRDLTSNSHGVGSGEEGGGRPGQVATGKHDGEVLLDRALSDGEDIGDMALVLDVGDRAQSNKALKALELLPFQSTREGGGGGGVTERTLFVSQIDDGCLYEGEGFDEVPDGVPDGYGTETYPDGSSFEVCRGLCVFAVHVSLRCMCLCVLTYRDASSFEVLVSLHYIWYLCLCTTSGTCVFALHLVLVSLHYIWYLCLCTTSGACVFALHLSLRSMCPCVLTYPDVSSFEVHRSLCLQVSDTCVFEVKERINIKVNRHTQVTRRRRHAHSSYLCVR